MGCGLKAIGGKYMTIKTSSQDVTVSSVISTTVRAEGDTRLHFTPDQLVKQYFEIVE